MMSSFQERAEVLKSSTVTDQLKYQKAAQFFTGEGGRYEEATLVLVFLRCLRQGLPFLLSSNDAAGGKFDDLVLFWNNKDNSSVSALFGQLKHKTSQTRTTIRRSDLIWHKKDNKKNKKNDSKKDFSIEVYHESFTKIRDSLSGDSYALVLYTNLDLDKDAQHMFVRHDPESVPGLELLQSGGCVYRLNPDDEEVKRALQGDDRFVKHFYLFCNQSNCVTMKTQIYAELAVLLGAGESFCADTCDRLCSSVREWMNSQDVCLTSNWSSWLDVVNAYVKKEVTGCNGILLTRLEYSCVAALEAHIRGCNPAWVRPPGREATALSATKVHQAVSGERHVMVSVKRFVELEEKILCCWGQFCRWLVLVDNAEDSFDTLLDIEKQCGPNRRLVIVSYKGKDPFRDTFKTSDIRDQSWKKLADVAIELNGEQHLCRLEDLCDTESLKAVLDGKPEAVVALSQQSGPLRMGQDLKPLPENHITRQLTFRMRVRQEFFSTLGEKEVCITDETSCKFLTNKFIQKNTVTFDEFEKYLSASDAVWPLLVVTNNVDRSAVQAICSEYADVTVYVLSYVVDGWDIHFLHRGRTKILPYIEDQSRSILQTVNGLGNPVIIEGKPGIGKSTVLLDMARQLKEEDPSWWIVRIDLLKYSEVFDRCGNGVEASKEVLVRTVHNGRSPTVLEHALLVHCLLEYPRIICAVDGFDEVCPDYVDKCLEALQASAPRRGKLVVTTRPSAKGHLEAALGVVAHSLTPFTEDQLHDFHGRPSSELGVTDAVRDLLKIPLFSRMYAESLESGVTVHDIVSLYEAFFERKFRRLYEEKWCENLSIPGKKKKFETERMEQEERHEFLAVSLLFPRLEIPPVAQSSSIDGDDVLKTGIVCQFADDKPVFIHRTFAEYFLAKWCFSATADGLRADVYREALSNGSLELFVECFDRLASRGRPLLTSVLDGSESDVRAVLEGGADPAGCDAVGRSSLHLLAAHGRDPELLRLLRAHLEAAGAAGAALEAEDALLRWTPLRYAAERRNCWAVAALLEAGAKLHHLGDFQRGVHRPEELWNVFSRTGYEGLFLHILVKNKSALRPETWEELLGSKRLAQFEVGLSIVCADMSTNQYSEILHEASVHNQNEVAKLLVIKMLDKEKKSRRYVFPRVVERRNQSGSSQPDNRREAAGCGCSACQQLTTGAVGVAGRRTVSDPMLYYAAATGNAHYVGQLISAGADVNIQTFSGASPIYFAVVNGNVDCMKLLISFGAEVNVVWKEGHTPLHCAALAGRAQSVKLLLDAGADGAAQDANSCTALHLAASTGNAECVRLLVLAVRDLELKDVNAHTALHCAARNGDEESLRHLLLAGARSSPVTNMLNTPLHEAARRGHAECVRQLLVAKADVAAKNADGFSALHFAVARGSPDCVRHLLKAGADICGKDRSGSTPLHWAASRGNEACVRLLLGEGADVQEGNCSGDSPLHCAADVRSARNVELLLAAGADPLMQNSKRETPLHLAATTGNAECVRLLISAVKNLELTDDNGRTALHCAAQNGNSESLRHLLSAGARNSPVTNMLNTPLHEAARRGSSECVRQLVLAKADVAARNADGFSALHFAARRSNPDCMKDLLKAGADIRDKDGFGNTALHRAAEAGSPACTTILLEEGANVHERNIDGDTPLHLASVKGSADISEPYSFDVTSLFRAPEGDSPSCIRLLVEAGADVNERNKDGDTPLHLASLSCYTESVKRLLEAGATPTVQNTRGETPLHCAAMRGRAKNMKLLLEAGSDTLVQDSGRRTPLHVAAMEGKAECVRLLTSEVKNLELTDVGGLTALHYAARNGDDRSLKHLLLAGAHNSPVTNMLNTPLHEPASRGNAECVRQLVLAKADVAAMNADGFSALHLAALGGNPDCVRHLVIGGAGIQQKGGAGSSPLHSAAKGGSPACVSILVDEGEGQLR